MFTMMDSNPASGEETWINLSVVKLGRLDWTINNFKTTGDDNYVQRKVFKCKLNNNKQLEWFFEMKLQGESTEHANYVSVFLHLNQKDEDFEEGEIHTVDFSVKLRGILVLGLCVQQNRKKQIFKKGNTINGWPLFCSKNFFKLPSFHPNYNNDQLNLECLFSYISRDDQSECVTELSDNLSALFNVDNPKFSDVTLCVGETRFPSHKNILSARSPVFAAMFECDMLENRENKVDIKDMKPEVLKKMLEFIYTGRASNIDDMAKDLLVAADRYDLITLKTLTEIKLESKLSITNAIELLIFADTYQANSLKQEATKCIVENIGKIRETPDWPRMVEEKPKMVDHILEAVINLIPK